MHYQNIPTLQVQRSDDFSQWLNPVLFCLPQIEVGPKCFCPQGDQLETWYELCCAFCLSYYRKDPGEGRVTKWNETQSTQPIFSLTNSRKTREQRFLKQNVSHIPRLVCKALSGDSEESVTCMLSNGNAFLFKSFSASIMHLNINWWSAYCAKTP